jgi:hypothetical protein
MTGGQSCLLACAVFVLACTSTDLMLPGQIRALPEVDDTREAILAGMQRRQWIFVDEAPGRIRARIDVRRHTAEAWIDYDEDAIRFSYAGSRGLDCRPAGDGCKSIHNSYNRWTRNLAIAIAEEVAERRAPRARSGSREGE